MVIAQNVMLWVSKNKEWLFSGAGITVILFVLGILFKIKKRKYDNMALSQKSGSNSVNLQSARDININKE